MLRKMIMISAVSLLLAGCAGISFPKITTPKKPETVYNWREEITKKPRAIIADDKTYVVEETKKTLQVGLETTPGKLMLGEKIGNWFSGLSALAIIALIIGLVLCPGATLAWLVKLLFKWKRAMKETVAAIKESKAVENAELHNALKDKQSVETKKIVGQIKADL